MPQTDAALSGAGAKIEIAFAAAAKQRSVATDQGQAAVALLEAARALMEQQAAIASARGGVDVTG